MLAQLGGLPRRQGLRAVAVAPTQELARQTHRELLKLAAGSGIEACVLTKKLAAAAIANAERGGSSGGGGGGNEGAAARTRAVGSVWRKFDAMVCTPLRLVGLLRKGALSLSSVRYLVLDEADKLLELGFLEQVDEILATWCVPRWVPRCAASIRAPMADVPAAACRRLSHARRFGCALR